MPNLFTWALVLSMRLCAAIAILLLLLPSIGTAEPAGFEVVYSESEDRACASERAYQVKKEWVKELNEILPDYRALWRLKAAAMFAAAASLTRRSTEAFALPIHLTLCDTPSQSFSGPRVNMRYALRSFAAQPVPLRFKVDTAFHESMHAFVSQYTPRTSPLLASHRSESVCVRNHLHLLALQKAVLLALGDAGALEQVISIDSQLPSGCYKRAWTLVNEAEATYKLYLAELTTKP